MVALDKFKTHKWILYFLFLVARKLSKRVTCHSTLNTADATCETEFACFTYVMSKSKKQYHGCIDSDLYRLFMCNVTPTSTFVSKCCHEDMCTKNLTLSLPTSDSSPRDDSKCLAWLIAIFTLRMEFVNICMVVVENTAQSRDNAHKTSVFTLPNIYISLCRISDKWIEGNQM